MAWAEQRRNLWVGYYRDPSGKKIRAGSTASRREATELLHGLGRVATAHRHERMPGQRHVSAFATEGLRVTPSAVPSGCVVLWRQRVRPMPSGNESRRWPELCAAGPLSRRDRHRLPNYR